MSKGKQSQNESGIEASAPASSVPAVTGQGTTALATHAPPSLSLASDILIPRILLGQGQSPFVMERKAVQGDIVRNDTWQKLATADGDPFLFIPLHEPVPMWRDDMKVGTGQQARWKFRKRYPRNAANDRADWTFWAYEDGTECEQGALKALEWKRTKMLELFALIPADIEAHLNEMKKAEKGEMPDISKALTPVSICFKATSLKAGQEITTFANKAKMFKLDLSTQLLKLGATFVKQDQGGYFAFTVTTVGTKPVPAAYLDAVDYWKSLVRSRSDLKTNDEGFDDPAN